MRCVTLCIAPCLIELVRRPPPADDAFRISVKLAPANQTYIPAANSGGQRFADDALGQALRTAVSGAQLKSVTIVASRPDDNVVVVQAQYAPDQDSPNTAIATLPRLAPRQPSIPRSASYLSPIEQYTRTQSGDSRLAPLLDVRA